MLFPFFLLTKKITRIKKLGIILKTVLTRVYPYTIKHNYHSLQLISEISVSRINFNMFRSIFFILSFLLSTTYHALGQTSAPKYSNEFLNIGVGARALGMSNAVVANTGGVTSGYWNPAGLLDLPTKYQVGLMHSEYFAGIAKYDYGAIAVKVDSSSALAFSIIRFGIDDIPDTRYLYDANGAINYDNIRYFSASDYAFILSYAKKNYQIPGLKMGANFKIVHRIVGSFASAWGFGLDAGAQYKVKSWSLGLMARDVTSTFNAWSHNTDMVRDVYIQTGNEIPQNSLEITLPRLILGASRQFLKEERKIGVMGSIDLVTTFDGKRNTLIKTGFASIDPVAGIEIDYKDMVYLRGGIGNIQKISDFEGSHYSIQPNFGIGVKIYRFAINYALTNLGNTSETLYSNVFSLAVNLN